MGFFDDLGKAVTSVATEVYKGVDVQVNQAYEENKRVIGALGAIKDQLAAEINRQWQEQQRVLTGIQTYFLLIRRRPVCFHSQLATAEPIE